MFKKQFIPALSLTILLIYPWAIASTPGTASGANTLMQATTLFGPRGEQHSAAWTMWGFGDNYPGSRALNGQDFSKRVLTESNFRKNHLCGANFSDTVLTASNFRWAQLVGANFRNAYVNLVDFRGANLASADFRGANLRGAKMRGANLANACYDHNTFLPEGLIPNAHGMINMR